MQINDRNTTNCSFHRTSLHSYYNRCRPMMLGYRGQCCDIWTGLHDMLHTHNENAITKHLCSHVVQYKTYYSTKILAVVWHQYRIVIYRALMHCRLLAMQETQLSQRTARRARRYEVEIVNYCTTVRKSRLKRLVICKWPWRLIKWKDLTLWQSTS